MMKRQRRGAAILLRALTTATGRTRETLVSELLSVRDQRAAPFYSYLVRHMRRRALPQIYSAALEALGSSGAPDAVDALNFALHQKEWWAPLRTRRIRATAAAALRQIGTPAALDALRAAASRGPRGVRVAARAQLASVPTSDSATAG